MRKIYSLVLMATMLLMGTNAKAAFTFTIGGETQSASSLYDAFTTVLNTPNAVAVITLTSAETLSGTPSRLKFNDGQDITLDLNGYGLEDGLRIDVINAKLKVINSGAAATIDASNCNGNGAQAFNTYGVSETDNTVARDACYFLLGENVTLNVKEYGVAVMYYGAFAGTSVDGRPTYGATVEIKGSIVASAGTGIATNGTMSFATGDKTKCPIINIYSTASITGSNALRTIQGANTSGEAKAVYDAKGAVEYKTTEAAVYGPGYAEWNISGTLQGGVGLYLKSGKYNIDNAKIHATAAEYYEPIAYGNGFIGAGSAIIFDKHAAYGGNIEMTIDGAGTEVHSNNGYAIQDVNTTNTGTPGQAETAVTNIEIKDGDYMSNKGGAISTTPELQEQILANGSITGGTYNETVAAYIDPKATDLVETAPGSGVYTVKVAVDVTLNGSGYATFSAKKNVELPATGLTVWKATELSGTNLGVEAVAGAVIPANTGVILVGEANGEFKLTETETDASAITGNLMKPATEWSASYAGNAYILHDNELWLYTGNEFKANKAFFVFSGGSSAPKRLRMVLNQTETPTAVENVETQNVKAVKFVGEDGQLYIRRGEAVYTVQGQVVK